MTLQSHLFLSCGFSLYHRVARRVAISSSIVNSHLMRLAGLMAVSVCRVQKCYQLLSCFMFSDCDKSDYTHQIKEVKNMSTNVSMKCYLWISFLITLIPSFPLSNVTIVSIRFVFVLVFVLRYCISKATANENVNGLVTWLDLWFDIISILFV